MPTIRLYTQDLNPFTAKVELALALKGLPYERVVSSDPADIKRWSPVTGLLPVIEIDGTRIADATVILRAIDLRVPEPRLLSSDPKTARDQQRLAEWSDSSFLFYWNRWREVDWSTVSSMVRASATGSPLTWRSSSSTAGISARGLLWVRTTQAIGPMLELSALTASVCCACGMYILGCGSCVSWPSSVSATTPTIWRSGSSANSGMTPRPMTRRSRRGSPGSPAGTGA